MSSNADTLIARKTQFQSDLLVWYRTHARVLPWRSEPSLYKTVVSELMLQQTQVKTALPYFERWMRELPGFAELAAASEARVLKLWEGLGYYSRARNLHKLARAVHAMPQPPHTPGAWRELPGIGPYTAAAITSIAFHVPAACVDGNVVRILARLTANDTEFRDSASAAKVLTPLASALIDGVKSPGDYNQAMMELGATLCTKQNPACIICPVRAHCAGTRTGEPEKIPRLASKKIESKTVTRIWCLDAKKRAVLLHCAKANARRFAGIHEVPSDAELGLSAKDLTGKNTKPLMKLKRSITRYRIEEIFLVLTPSVELRARIGALVKKRSGPLRWVPLDELDHITLSGPHRRIVVATQAAKSSS